MQNSAIAMLCLFTWAAWLPLLLCLRKDDVAINKMTTPATTARTTKATAESYRARLRWAKKIYENHKIQLTLNSTLTPPLVLLLLLWLLWLQLLSEIACSLRQWRRLKDATQLKRNSDWQIIVEVRALRLRVLAQLLLRDFTAAATSCSLLQWPSAHAHTHAHWGFRLYMHTLSDSM